MLLPSSLNADRSALVSAVLAAGTVSALYALMQRLPKHRFPVHDLPSSHQEPTPVPYLPSRLPLMGNTLQMARNADRFLAWLLEQSLPRDGEPFALQLLGRSDLVFTARPEHYEQILKTQSENFGKGDHLHDILVDVMGEGILIVEGERWKYQRRVFLNLFSARALREHMAPIIQQHTLVFQDVLSRAAAAQEPLDMYTMMHRFTFDAFSEIGFGIEGNSLASGVDDRFERAQKESQLIVLTRKVKPVWLWKLQRWLGVGEEGRLRESVRVVDELILSIISRSIERRNARTSGESEKGLDRNVIAFILDNMETDQHPIDPEEVRAIALAALLAGRDTTADALSWLVHMLSRHPRVEEKLRSELLSKLPKLGTDATYVPSLDDVQDLVYLDATICEVLRLHPVVSLVTRHCIRDTVFPDGTFIPEGMGINMAMYVTPRLTSVWGADAASFVPERFIDNTTGKLLQIPPTKFTAFGAGPRGCVGQRLGMLEMKIVVAGLVSRFRLVEVPGQDVTHNVGMTLGMKNPLMMIPQRVGLVGV